MDVDKVQGPKETLAAATPSVKRQLENMDDPDLTSKRAKYDTAPAEHREPQEDLAIPSSSTRKQENVKAQKGKGKQKEKKDRRRGTRGDRDLVQSRTDSADGPASPGNEQKAPRLPKRQCAMLIGFCGAGYNGMQIQKDVKTIEGVLFDALVKAGAVSQDNADNPVKVNLGRAARTDAGVHAAGNVVSMKLITAVPGVPDLVARVNEELPPEIRLWGMVRVQNSFNARASCDSRRYTYFFPSYMLIPPKPGSGLYQTSLPTGDLPPLHPFWEIAGMTSSKEDDLSRKREYRIPLDTVVLLRETAKRFEGTHNFHNFTVGREFGDRSNQRFIKQVQIEDPVVYGNTEWVSVLIHGQSFMLHQIRKMVSALILACRTNTPAQVIDEMYGPRMVFMPKMPALGLLLEYPIFESYGRRVEDVNKGLQPSDSEYRPPIDFEIHRDKIDKFKQDFIYSRMRSIEDRNGIFDAWIRSIDAYSGNDLLYLNSKGVIPPAAFIRRGERRNNPFREKRKFDATTFAERPTGDFNDDETLVSEEEEQEEEKLDKKELADMEG